MDPEVKKIQLEMQKLGLYDGPIDGRMGPGTKAAIDVYRQQQKQAEDDRLEKQAKIDRENAEAKAKRDREDADAREKREAAQRTEQEARDQRTGMITAGSVGAGMGVGFGGAKIAEHYATPAMQREMTARSAQLKNLAATIRAIDPTSKDARALHKDAVSAAERGGLTKKPLPWGTAPTGASLVGFGAYSSFDRAPNAKSDVERAIWTGTGYGEMTAGVKMLADSLRRYKNPGVAYPGDDLAAVESSRRIAAGGPVTSVAPPASAAPYSPPGPETPPETPPSKPSPNPGTRTDLYNQAKARGLPVTTRTKKADLEKVLSEALKKSARAARKAPKALVPGAVGYGVYDALRSPAEAADGSAAPIGRGEAAAAGAGAAAATAGAGALGKQLLNSRLGQVLMRGAGRVAGPVGVGLTAYDTVRGIDALAHLSPPQDPRDYSTMGAFMPPEVDPAYAPREPFAEARSLGVPQMGGGGDEFAELEAASAADPELAEMIKELILARVGDAQMNQVPNAVASGQVSSMLRNFGG